MRELHEGAVGAGAVAGEGEVAGVATEKGDVLSCPFECEAGVGLVVALHGWKDLKVGLYR